MPTPNCQREKEGRAPGGTRTHVAALRVRNPRRWTTSASFPPSRTRGARTLTRRLRAGCAAANTLVPSIYAHRVGPEGVEPPSGGYRPPVLPLNHEPSSSRLSAPGESNPSSPTYKVG